MIYLYAIGHSQPGVETVCDADLAAFVRRGVTQPPAPEPDALVSHDRVVSTLAENGAVLPMRFGTVVRGEDVIRELLTKRGEHLRRQLDHVRGRVEIGVRAMWPEPEQGASSSRGPGTATVTATGREFMQAKLDRHRAARRKADELHAPFAELAADSVLTLCRTRTPRSARPTSSIAPRPSASRSALLASALPSPVPGPRTASADSPALRIDADPEHVERGLAGLVLTVVDLLRELMERQALRRMEGGAVKEDVRWQPHTTATSSWCWRRSRPTAIRAAS